MRWNNLDMNDIDSEFFNSVITGNRATRMMLTQGFLDSKVRDKNGVLWILEKYLSKGGMGKIYIAHKMNTPKQKVVIKMEEMKNNTLSTEINVYQNILETTKLQKWKSMKKDIEFLHFPKMMGSGTFNFRDLRFRFLVIPKFPISLQNFMFKYNLKKLTLIEICQITKTLINSLQFLHYNKYVHADIKSDNIVFLDENYDALQIIMIDYGLAHLFDISKVIRKPMEKFNDGCSGTKHYCSINAHTGVKACFVDDIESICYNIFEWVTGSLDWMRTNHRETLKKKKEFRTNYKNKLQIYKLTKFDFIFTVAYKTPYNEYPDYDLMIDNLYKLYT
uniref:non-specific serine/threonine protein kinase n=1 Tax=viral metagenome TaxID=1070528 RepID=A0A6C0JQ74_9ZZZZ